MFSKKRQIIKFEQNLCHADANDNKILFVRVSDIVTDKDAEIEIPLSHLGYVIKGGGDARMYKSGTYKIFDNKDEIKNWKKGLSVEVVYMPVEAAVVIPWGTPDQLRFRDEISNKVIDVGASGTYELTLYNHEQFFRKVVGTKKEFDIIGFTDRFRDLAVNEFTDCFLKTVKELNLTYDQFSAHVKDIGDRVGELLSIKFKAEYGVTLRNFIIKRFQYSDEAVAAIEDAAAEAQKQRKLQAYLAELERLDDKEWEREKYLRQLELQDRAAYYEVLKVVGHPGSGVNNRANVAGDGFCPNCGGTIKRGDVFCSKCGYRIVKEKVVCSRCGKENDGNAAFCTGCGNKLK